MLLVRHAETAAPDVFHGAESDIGLSERGIQQSTLLGRALAGEGPTALYCSAMTRARETAAAVGAVCKLTPIEIPAMHERRIGALSGLSRQEGWSTYAECKARWIAGDLEYSHVGGESFAAIERRVVPIFKELADAHAASTIIVVVHGVVIRVAITTMVQGFTPAEFDWIAIDFASVNDLWYDGRTWTARALNRVIAPSPARPVA